MEPLEWLVAILCISPIVGLFSMVMPSLRRQAWYQKLSQKAKDASIYTINYLHYKTIWRWVHPKIAAEAKSRFDSGHFADAIEAACKVIDQVVQDMVEERSGALLSGQLLMTTAFNVNKPVIRLTKSIKPQDGNSATERSVQEGFMHLFMGTVGAFRNPTAHKNLKLNPITAIKFLYFASLLLDELENDVILGNVPNK